MHKVSFYYYNYNITSITIKYNIIFNVYEYNLNIVLVYKYIKSICQCVNYSLSIK